MLWLRAAALGMGYGDGVGRGGSDKYLTLFHVGISFSNSGS